MINLNSINITSNEANQRLDRFIRKYLKNVSLSDIYKFIRKKDIRVNGQKTKENYRLLEGDVVEIYIEDEKTDTYEVPVAERNFSIIYEDDNILILNKPPELIMHSDISHTDNTLVDQVIYYLYQTGKYNPENETTFKPAAVNRLDLNTGGVVLFAKNYKSLQGLNVMVRDRLISKYYICIVKGKMEGEQDIKSFLIKDEINNKVEIIKARDDKSKEIHTRFKVLKASNDYSLVEVDLITGRSHQIRAQLSNIGHPIIGDMKYGDNKVNIYFKEGYKLKNQFLYAYKVKFDSAAKGLDYLENKSFNAVLPYNYKSIIKQLFDIDMEQR